MAFSRTKYEDNSLGVHSIKMSPEKLALAGTAPGDEVGAEGSVQVSKNSREYGIRPRGVTLSRTAIAPVGSSFTTVFLPVLTIDGYNSAAFALNTAKTYKTLAYTITARINESSK